MHLVLLKIGTPTYFVSSPALLVKLALGFEDRHPDPQL